MGTTSEFGMLYYARPVKPLYAPRYQTREEAFVYGHLRESGVFWQEDEKWRLGIAVIPSDGSPVRTLEIPLETQGEADDILYFVREGDGVFEVDIMGINRGMDYVSLETHYVYPDTQSVCRPIFVQNMHQEIDPVVVDLTDDEAIYWALWELVFELGQDQLVFEEVQA